MLNKLISPIKIMIQLVAGIIVIGLTYLLYKFYLEPRRACLHYQKALTKMGLKVYYMPVEPFGVTMYDHFKKFELAKNDAFIESKTVLPGYDVIVTNLLDQPHIIFINWKMIKQLFNPDKVYILPKSNVGLQLMKAVGGKGFFFSEGEKWKNKRKVMSKIFNFDFITSQVPIISKIFDKLFTNTEESYWRLHPRQAQTRQIETQMFRVGVKMFAMVMTTCFLGIEAIEQIMHGKKIEEFIIELTELSASLSLDPLIVLFGSKFYKLGLKEDYRLLAHKARAMQQLNSKYLVSVKEKISKMSDKQKQNPKTIMEALIILKEQQQGKKVTHSDQQLNEELLTFLLAGSDVTSIFFTTMIFFVHQHKEVEQKLRTMINETFKSDEDITYENLKKMEYLEWVQFQTLRVFRPARGQFDRVATQDMLLGELAVKKGTVINYNPKAIFYDPNIFEDPEVFRPERWQHENPNFSTNELMSLGFSGGPRGCLGKYLALLETKIALVKFMKRYTNVTQTQQRIYSFSFASNLNNTGIKFTKI